MFDKKISNWLYKVYDKVAMREIIMNSVFCKKSIRNLSLRGGGKKRKKKIIPNLKRINISQLK